MLNFATGYSTGSHIVMSYRLIARRYVKGGPRVRKVKNVVSKPWFEIPGEAWAKMRFQGGYHPGRNEDLLVQSLGPRIGK